MRSFGEVFGTMRGLPIFGGNGQCKVDDCTTSSQCTGNAHITGYVCRILGLTDASSSSFLTVTAFTSCYRSRSFSQGGFHIQLFLLVSLESCTVFRPRSVLQICLHPPTVQQCRGILARIPILNPSSTTPHRTSLAKKRSSTLPLPHAMSICFHSSMPAH